MGLAILKRLYVQSFADDSDTPVPSRDEAADGRSPGYLPWSPSQCRVVVVVMLVKRFGGNKKQCYLSLAGHSKNKGSMENSHICRIF